MKPFVARVKRVFTGLAQRLGKVARRMAGGSVLTLVIAAGLSPSSVDRSFAVHLIMFVAFVGLVVSAVLWLGGWVTKLWGLFKERSVEIVDGGVRLLRGEEAIGEITSERIVSGMVGPRAEGAELRLLLRGGDQLRLRVGDTATAEQALEALDLGPGRKRLAVRWARFIHRFLAALGGLLATATPLILLNVSLKGSWLYLPTAFAFLFVPYFAAGWASRQVGRQVIVGTDGVRGVVGRRRFDVRFADLETVERGHYRMILKTSKGYVFVPLDADDDGVSDAVAHRLERAFALYRERGGSRAELFLRGDEPLAEWKERLSGLLRRDRGHRDAAISREDALAVLRDPEADPEARAGAAIALSWSGDPDDGARKVRVAIESVASPRVRVALDAAARGELEEEVLERARREHDRASR